MSVDLKKLREKLEELKNPRKGGTKFNRKVWPLETAKDGDEKTIRMIQYPFTEDPIVELWFHYSIGKGPHIVCPRMTAGKSCPCCEFAFELNKSGDKDTAKKLWSKQRMYLPIVDRGEETASIKYWGFGKDIYQKLIESLLSEDYGTFLDPVNGLDAVVKWAKKGDSGYIVPSFTFKRKESRLAATDQQIQDLLKTIQPIEEIFKPITASEISERLASWLNMGENDGGEVSKGPAKTADEDSGEDSGSSVKDLEASFNEALKD